MASNYQKDDQGSTFIPSTQRPDGTWRKQRRVKEGYVPQEEVPLYESKGKQLTKNKPTYPVGLSPEFIAQHKAKQQNKSNNPIPGLIIENTTKSKKSKKKKKASTGQVEAKANETSSTISTDNNDALEALEKMRITEPSCQQMKSDSKASKQEQKKKKKRHDAKEQQHNQHLEEEKEKEKEKESCQQSQQTDSYKRIRTLKKKIREIQVLSEKINNGGIKNPDDEMLAKIIKKEAMEKELFLLEQAIADK